jgi:DNA-directed RNA polymerase specialized sigma24 family protein
MIDENEPPEEVPDADVELRDRLQATGCTGPAWDYVASELAHYGWSVMSAWLRTGMIAQKCLQKGRRVELPADWTVDDREDLVATAVANGMEIFRQALIDDRWKPERGASLKTYFLGGCILAFPNALRQWRNDRQRYNRAAVTYALHEVTVSRSMVEPFDVVDAIDALRALTRDENERTQAIRRLRFDNYTPAEIAEILGMTTGAVKAALIRMRHRASHHTWEAG